MMRAVASALLIAASLACHSQQEDAGDFPRSQTFYVAGRQWGEPSSFNPLLSSPDWPAAQNLMYESLFVFNPATGKMDPLLGETYSVSGNTIQVTMHPAARWTDGRPVTADDVKFSFDLGHKYKSLPHSPTWQYLTEVRVTDAGSELPRQLEFSLNPERRNPLVVLDAFQTTRIVPKHVLEPALAKVKGDINEFNKLKFDKNPVTSGPYKLHIFSGEKVVAVRNDEYWGNKAYHDGKLPRPKYIIHPIFKSNDHFSIGLQQGRLDGSSTFIPRIWLKARKGVHAWYDEPPYFPPSSIPMLFINVLHKPLSDVKMRRAMAFAINYKDIRELAVSGYSDEIKPGLILPFGLESKYFSEEDAKQHGATFHDPARAKALLAEAGYRGVYNAKGELLETRDASGAKMPTIFIKSPTGWSDWESIVRIVVRSLRDVGIDAREKFVDSSIFWNALFQGDFNMIMSTPSPAASPSKPWSRFEAVLTSREYLPEGEKMYNNMGRFNNPNGPGYIPRIGELLTLIPTLHNETELVAAYRELNRIYMEQQPTLPLVYRPESFYEFSERNWKGFPTAKNPYLPPLLPGDGLGTRMLWRLEPANSKN
jgi:peptide/nickel transport system substrate-binding protein